MSLYRLDTKILQCEEERARDIGDAATARAVTGREEGMGMGGWRMQEGTDARAFRLEEVC